MIEVSPHFPTQIDIELRADLTRHQRTVNIVRFSNSGEVLASGDDEANIILWKIQSSEAPQLFDSTENKENWQVFKVRENRPCYHESDFQFIRALIGEVAVILPFTRFCEDTWKTSATCSGLCGIRASSRDQLTRRP